MLTKDIIIDKLIEQKLWTNRTLTKMCVVGIRGFHSDMGKKDVNDRGIYDDVIAVLSPDQFRVFSGNTDPSRFREGVAMLVAPQTIRYISGYHGYGRKSGHAAFRQDSNVIVKRDGGVGNGKALGNGLFTDSESNRFWTNLHRGGVNTTSSEGCQTITNNQWSEFHSLVHKQMDKYNQDSFKYYLINK